MIINFNDAYLRSNVKFLVYNWNVDNGSGFDLRFRSAQDNYNTEYIWSISSTKSSSFKQMFYIPLDGGKNVIWSVDM